MPHTIVIFGASGDLTSRKLVPAIYNLMRGGSLPADTRIVGFSRTPMRKNTAKFFSCAKPANTSPSGKATN